MKELIHNIRYELMKKLDEIYNYRKAQAGIICVHNTLCDSVQRKINEWAKEEEERFDRIEKMKVGR